MKKLFSLVFLLTVFWGMAQKKYYILFNSQIDKVVRINKWGSAFYLKVPGEKPIFFSGTAHRNYSKNTFDLAKVVSREKLKKIIHSDNTDEGKYDYIVVYPKAGKYYFYFVTHNLRKIVDYVE